MSLGMWYKVLYEKYVANEEDENEFTFPVISRTERLHPNLQWETIWPLSSSPGLDSGDSSFLFRILHNLLTTQEGLNRVLSHTVTNPKLLK